MYTPDVKLMFFIPYLYLFKHSRVSHCYGNVFTSYESVLCSLYSSNRVFVTCSNSLSSLLVVSMKRCLLSSCANDENK